MTKLENTAFKAGFAFRRKKEDGSGRVLSPRVAWPKN